MQFCCALARALLGVVLVVTMQAETLTYTAEWRFVKAGDIKITWDDQSRAELTVKSVGLVDTLYGVSDRYTANYDPGHCVTSTALEAIEGKRRRETKVTFDKERKKAAYLEKDMVKDAVVLSKEIDIPACVHDVVGALHRLREVHPAPGTSVEWPLSDGKKVIMGRVEAQERETIKTPMGQFSAVRYEAFLFNGNLYARKGRLFIWVSDDERHLPVQIRVQLPFYVGTVTLQLEKAQ